jgi:ABC-type glycerol-3-phosphate transport system permease component
MPIAVPGTVATRLFGFLLAWQDLPWALCLIAIDAKRTLTLGVAFAVGEFMVKWPMLTAALLIGSLPTIILYLLLQRFYVEALAGVPARAEAGQMRQLERENSYLKRRSPWCIQRINGGG